MLWSDRFVDIELGLDSVLHVFLGYCDAALRADTRHSLTDIDPRELVVLNPVVVADLSYAPNFLGCVHNILALAWDTMMNDDLLYHDGHDGGCAVF